MEQKYSIIKELGKGQFGIAYLVVDKQTNQEVVMKKLNIKGMSENEKKEALQEVDMIKQFSHPNIVKYIESFTSDNHLYIIMEYADSKDFDELLKVQKTKGRFTEDQILYYFVQMALGLKHIHDRRILHRDLKGANIFLSSKSQNPLGYQVKLGDFGVSRVLEQQEDLATTFAGTPYYMAPEMFKGEGYNNKSDVWSIGCLLYEMCTFDHIVKATSMQTLIMKVMKEETPKITDRYSAQLQNILDQTLQKDPKKRASVRQLLQNELLMKWIPKVLTRDVIMREFAAPGTNRNVVVEQPRPALVNNANQIAQAPQPRPSQHQAPTIPQQVNAAPQQPQFARNNAQQASSAPTIPTSPHSQPNYQQPSLPNQYQPPQQQRQQIYQPQQVAPNNILPIQPPNLQMPSIPGQFQLQPYTLPKKEDYANQNLGLTVPPTLPSDDFFGDRPKFNRCTERANNSRQALINQLGQANFEVLQGQVKRKILFGDDTIDMRLCNNDPSIINQMMTLLLFEKQ